MNYLTKQEVVLDSEEPILTEHDINHWPLTLMWEMGKEKEVNHTADMMVFGIIPWRIDVHSRLEGVVGRPLPFIRSNKAL